MTKKHRDNREIEEPMWQTFAWSVFELIVGVICAMLVVAFLYGG